VPWATGGAFRFACLCFVSSFAQAKERPTPAFINELIMIALQKKVTEFKAGKFKHSGIGK
jgi:hypothetical protein